MSCAALARCRRRAAVQRGVTLIELMVGMLIGMLAILVISQVLLVSEGQKRTTASGSDAQVNGALSLYAISRDIQTAGYGFSSSPAIVGCPIAANFGGAAPANFPATLAPIIITPNASGDSIRMLASSKTTYTVPTRVIPPGFLVSGFSFPVGSSMGFVQGDLGLVAIDGVQACSVFQVTAVPAAMSIPRADDGVGWNKAATPTLAYPDGSVVVNLGTLIDNTYSLVNGELRLTSFDIANPGANPRPSRVIQSDVVGLRAYYGRDTSVTADGIVDTYDTTTPTTNAEWRRVVSVRLLVVSRSGQYEKDVVTPANPTWDVGSTPSTADATTCGTSKCVTFDVGAGAAGDAQHYRYKVFETIVPLRNMMWSS